MAIKAQEVPTAKSLKPTEKEMEILENVVKKSLKDPDSAVFRDAYDLGKAACVEVNAKNSYGGFSGFQTALLFKTDGVWKVFSINNKGAKSTCNGMVEDAIKKEIDASE